MTKKKRRRCSKRLASALSATNGVRDFSGGMKRRLALARALLAPCDALALDEPFTGLDAGNRDIALSCILRAAEKKIVLLAAHEALDLPDARTVQM